MSESEAKHTPGPTESWHVENEPYNVWDADGLLVCRVNAPLEPDEAWARGCRRARLIAAAPDLLAACQEMLITVDECYKATGHFKVAKTSEQRLRLEAAIAKATKGA